MESFLFYLHLHLLFDIIIGNTIPHNSHNSHIPHSHNSHNSHSHNNYNKSILLGHPLLERGNCKLNTWRIDEIASIPGKCVGINPLHEIDDLKDIPVYNSIDCRSLCCNLGERCTTWQFQNSTKTCFIHRKPFRRGPEGADTPLYCDPFPTHKWNGKFLKERNDNGKCTWAYELPSQCFAFGPERLNNNGIISMEKGNRMNTEECEQACCNDKTCNSYQEYPGRGCYYGTSDCQYKEIEGGYEGGRKCLPEFCGGKENEVLTPEQIVLLKKFVEYLKKSD